MKRPPKFHNKKIVIDGETFDSQGEAKWFHSLKLMQRAGAIDNLRRQVSMPLHGADGSVVATLILDAVWDETYTHVEGTQGWLAYRPVYADFKGMETPISRLKRKLFAAEYGAQIRIFTDKGEVSYDKRGRKARKQRNPGGRARRVADPDAAARARA